MNWVSPLFMIGMLLILVGCFNDEPSNKSYKISGNVFDLENSQFVVPSIKIEVDVVQSGGFLTGYRELAGRTKTSSNGDYSLHLTIPKDADFLEFFINPANENSYFAQTEIVSIPRFIDELDQKRNFGLDPSARLKIKFKNESGTNSYFDFSSSVMCYHDIKYSGLFGMWDTHNCGVQSPLIDEGFTYWQGQGVCGELVFSSVSGRKAAVYWTLRDNENTKLFIDSIFVERSAINEFILNY